MKLKFCSGSSLRHSSRRFLACCFHDGGEGASRSKRTQRVLVPLVVGFALTGLLIGAITAVKLLLLKALLVSKVALLAALWVVARRLLSAIGAHHHPYLYSHHKLPQVHHGYDAAGYSAAASDLGYAYAGYYGGGPAYPSAPADYAHYGHYAHDAGVGVGGDDLQGHYSNQVAAVQHAPPPPPSQAPPPQRNATRQLQHQPHQQQPAARTDGMRHAVYGLVKSSANRVPVNTYRKLVTTGRNLQA